MATTSNEYTGNNSTVDFSFTFPYQNATDIKVSLNEVVQTLTTHYTLHNATTIRFGSAPGTGVKVKIYRDTDSSKLAATFYPGSAIRSSDLNDNFNQNIYVTQEAENDSTLALENSRTLDAGVYTSAISIANEALATADSALDTANIAYASSDAAITASNNAITTANAASDAVALSVPFTLVDNKAALLAASPSVGDTYEITDTTNIQNSSGGTITWVDSGGSGTTLPSGVSWGPAITAKVEYKGTTEKWRFMSYWSNDPENHYVISSDASISGPLTFLASGSTNDSTFECQTQDAQIKYLWPNVKPSANQVLSAGSVSSNIATLDWVTDATLSAPASAGTVGASELCQVDSDKDITGFRNITLTGELDGGSLDISGNADIDGTCEADAYTVNGTALDTHIAGVTVTNATNSAHVLVTDNENTNEENLITFVEGATDTTGNVGLEMDGNLSYNPSTGTITATVIKGSSGDFNGDVDIAGDLTFSGAARDLKLLDNTAAALDITESTNSYIKFDTTNGDELITVSKATAGAVYDIGSSPGATITIDFANGNNQKVTLSANFTLAEPSNQVPGQSGSIFFIQPGGANYSISSIHGDWHWPGGTDGTLTASNGAVDRLDYIILADNSVHAVMSKAMAA